MRKQLSLLGLRGERGFILRKDSIEIEVYLTDRERELSFMKFLNTATVAIVNAEGDILVVRSRDMSVKPDLEISSKYLGITTAKVIFQLLP